MTPTPTLKSFLLTGHKPGNQQAISALLDEIFVMLKNIAAGKSTLTNQCMPTAIASPRAPAKPTAPAARPAPQAFIRKPVATASKPTPAPSKTPLNDAFKAMGPTARTAWLREPGNARKLSNELTDVNLAEIKAKAAAIAAKVNPNDAKKLAARNASK